MSDRRAKLVMSYSKAKVYACPKKYQYQYIERLPKDENARNNLPGRAIQKLFEIFINGKYYEQGSKWLYENLEAVFQSEYEKFEQTTRFHVGETYEDVLIDVRDQIPVSADLFTKKGWYKGTIISEYYMEAWLTADIKIIGTADYLIKLPDDKVIILDFKSTAKGLKALDREQLLIYSFLYKFNYGRYPDEIYFFLTRDNQLVKLKLDPTEISAVIEKVTQMGRDIIAGKFQKNPSKENCQYCPFKVQCWGSAKKSPW